MLFKRILAETIEDEYFLREGCHYFAIALHDVLNYQIIIFEDRGREWDLSKESNYYEDFNEIYHVFATDGNGRYYDVRGEFDSIRGLMDRWLVKKLINPNVFFVSKRELLEDYMGSKKPFYRLDEEVVEDAKEKIRSNIEKYS